MSEIVDIIQKIVRHELAKIRIGELGVVTSIFPHSDEGDNDNYECSVKLKNSGLELRRVPIATNHIGTAAVPNVDDLVLVSFVSGDVNQPIVIGRLYNDGDRPPVNNANEYTLQSPYNGSTQFKIDTDESIILAAGGTTVTLKKDGEVSIQCTDCKINASGNIDLGEGGGGVVTNMTHKCFITGAPPVGSITVKAKA